jgi:hypothetical protein
MELSGRASASPASDPGMGECHSRQLPERDANGLGAVTLSSSSGGCTAIRDRQDPQKRVWVRARSSKNAPGQFPTSRS